jgi:hypothetical protein
VRRKASSDGLVRRLVLREADVAIDPERRTGRVGGQRQPGRCEPFGQRHAQGLERSLEQALVLRFARLEPGAIVVGRQVGQELHGVGLEPGERLGCGGHGGVSSGWSMTPW